MARITQAAADNATALADSYNSAIAAVKADGDLSAEGRLKELARLYVDAESSMDEIRQEFDGGTQKSTCDLTRELFGAVSIEGADAISVRDAEDRAAQLDNAEEAVALLERAESNGDDVLARAIARHAYTQARGLGIFGSEWAEVLDSYSSMRPDFAAKVTELAQLQASSLQSALLNFATFTIAKPAELERLSSVEVQGLADQQRTGSTRVGYP